MNRGMDHAKMMALISTEGPIAKLEREVDEFFGRLEKDYVNEVAQAYEGDASTLFNQNLKTTSTKMKGLLAEILTKCKEVAEGKDQEYIEQEKRMESSLEIGKTME